MAFIAIQCPSCASTDVTLRGGGHYQCNHCNTAFMRHAQLQTPPPPPPPPRPLSTPINSYGPPPPQPTIAPQPVHHVPTARFRWGLWLFIMLMGFGAPLIAAGVSFLQVNDATQAATRAIEAATQPAKPEGTEQVVPRKSSANLGGAEVPASNPPAEASTPRGEGTSLEGFQRLQGCSCAAKAGDVDLYTRHEGGGTTITGAGTTHSMELAFALKVGDITPFTLPLGPNTSPASSYTRGSVPVGIGCEGDTVVIATQRRLSGWSIEERTEAWTVELPSSYGEVEPGDAASIDCRSLTVRGGSATVDLQGGETVAVDVATGTLGAARSTKGREESKPKSEPEPKPEPEPEPKPEPEPEAKPIPPKPEPEPEPSSDDAKASKKKKGKKKKGKKKQK